jgi:hypothetical protein
MAVILISALPQNNMSSKCFIAFLNATGQTKRSDSNPRLQPRCLRSPHASLLRRKVVSSRDDILQFGQYHFLGVVSGYYYEDEEFNLEIAITVKGTGHANSGVAMIVPAYQVKELIENNADLKRLRYAAK